MDHFKLFSTIFYNKGNIGPIAEKARRNYEIVSKNEHGKNDRIYHFCIGHAFKNIDKEIFEYGFDDDTKKPIPNQYELLQKDEFTFENDLKLLVENIRNCNSHYVHTFDKLKIDSLASNLNQFIIEAFEFAFLQMYFREMNITYAEYKSNTNQSCVLQNLIDKFFPNKDYQKEERTEYLAYTLREAIVKLLFIHVEEDFEWNIGEDHKVFSIKKGFYFSSTSQLFVLSLFLYKNEANQLISKIKGFKNNEDAKRYKRDIFTFFSKKLTSQDIDSEEKYLVRFRDIIQYLNKYPTVWNNHLEPSREYISMTNALEKHVIETEIFRSFPTFKDTEHHAKFLEYTVNELFDKKERLFDFSRVILTSNEKTTFHDELKISPELKALKIKLKQLQSRPRKDKERKKINDKIDKLKKAGNPVKSKLQNRIKENKVLMSYGRNQDRFMQIALRFLAEEHYFGESATFKLYQFYTTAEQNVFIEKQKKELSKKEYDKLKYHEGKLVHFETFQQHAKHYPEWDTPFVIENNAFQVKITLSNGEVKLVSIQRKLLVYLLEDALYKKKGTSKNHGQNLIADYLLNNLLPDFESRKENLKTNTITATDKKLFPKRFLYQYQTAIQHENDNTKVNPYEKIIAEAERNEKRYQSLAEKAKDLGLEKEFAKKNKGKQFKLRFIRKVWQILYFKPAYDEQVEQLGHHKSFNITKDEFNDFCRYMFAFDEVVQYKPLLQEMLKRKNFFDNADFKVLFDKGNSLNDFYFATKEKFGSWSKINQPAPKNRNNDYVLILSKPIVYINLSHFLNYLEATDNLIREDDRITFNALENIEFLIEPYYYKNVLPKEEFKTNGKLFNKLKDIKLEDALLYELAMNYLHVDKSIVKETKSKVTEILNSVITFEIKKTDGKFLYNLLVPFNKLESLAVLIQHKTDQEMDRKNANSSFLSNIHVFLENKKYHNKDIKEISTYFKNKGLKFEELIKINNFLLTESVKFSRVQMELERYFIIKEKIELNDFKIDFQDIKDGTCSENQNIFDKYKYHADRIRQKAFHFGIPKSPYLVGIENMETIFIANEIKLLLPKSFNDLDKKTKSVCKVFMNILHNKLYRRNYDKKQGEIDFENKYFEEIIKK